MTGTEDGRDGSGETAGDAEVPAGAELPNVQLPGGEEAAEDEQPSASPSLATAEEGSNPGEAPPEGEPEGGALQSSPSADFVAPKKARDRMARSSRHTVVTLSIETHDPECPMQVSLVERIADGMEAGQLAAAASAPGIWAPPRSQVIVIIKLIERN